MLVPDGAQDFLLGRLTRERRAPLAVVRGFPGRWRGFTGNSALAVTEGLLWLATPRLIGEPSVASVAAGTVSDVSMRARAATAVDLRMRVGGNALRFTVVEDEFACHEFVAALLAESARQ